MQIHLSVLGDSRREVKTMHDRRLLWTVSFHHLCNDGTLMVLVAVIPVLVDVMDLSYYDVGILGLTLAITVIAQFMVGKYTDRRFSVYVLEIGVALMAMSFLLLLLVNDFKGILLAVIAMRVGAAFYHPVGISWITRAYAGPGLDRALGVQSGFGNMGVILALASSGYLAESFSWKIPCVIWALLNIAAIAVGLSVINRSSEMSGPARSKEPIGSVLTLRKIGWLTVPIIAGGALYQVTSYFGPLNLTTSALQWTAGDADLMFAIWIGVGTVTSYYFGSFSSRFGRTKILWAAYTISSVAAVILAITALWYVVAPTLVFYGALLFITYPALFALVTEATHENERGTAFGIIFGFQLGGGAILVYACGAVAEAFGDPAYAFIIVSVLSAVSLVFLKVWEMDQRIRSEKKAA